MKTKGMKTRVLSLALAVLFVFLAVGCAPIVTSPSGTGDKTPTQTDETKTPADETKTPAEATPAPKGDGREMVGNMYKTGLPIAKEPVSYYFMGLQMNNTRPNNLDETDMMLKIAKETNISIDWELVPQASWTEKKTLTIASGEYPDAFFGPLSLSSNEVQNLGANGVLVALDDLLAKYAPNITAIIDEYPIYESFLRSMDGNLYQLGSLTDEGFDSLISTIINKEWLDKLGLPVPTTTDEFYNTLKAFKNNDLNGNGQRDEIPLSFLYVEGSNINREVKRDHRPFYYAFGSLDTPFYININDKDEVFFTAMQDEWKEATKFLHKLYAEKLIDQEVFTQDRTLLTQKLRTQKNVGVYTDYRKDQSMILPEDHGKYTFVPPLKAPNGTVTWARAEVSIKEGAFAITSACENPEMLVRWIDHCNQEQYTPQMAFGMFKPAGYSEAEALVPSAASPGKYEVNTGLRPKSVDPTEWFMTAPIAQGCTLLTKKTLDEYVAEKASSVAKLKACEVYRPYLSKWPYNYPYKFSTEEVEELSLLQTDIASYVDSKAAEWIVEGGIDQEWDGFIAELKRLGVDRYLELYQTAFARVEGK